MRILILLDLLLCVWWNKLVVPILVCLFDFVDNFGCDLIGRRSRRVCEFLILLDDFLYFSRHLCGRHLRLIKVVVAWWRFEYWSLRGVHDFDMIVHRCDCVLRHRNVWTAWLLLWWGWSGGFGSGCCWRFGGHRSHRSHCRLHHSRRCLQFEIPQSRKTHILTFSSWISAS